MPFIMIHFKVKTVKLLMSLSGTSIFYLISHCISSLSSDKDTVERILHMIGKPLLMSLGKCICYIFEVTRS